MRRPLIFLAITQLLPAQEKISYDDHVLPIFEQACLNCHNPDKTKGGLDLSNFAGAMKGGSSGKIVEPGDTSSTLINLVKQTAEPKMPPEGEKLSGEQIDILVKWVEGGLLQNKSSKARKPSKPKFETALRSDPSAKPEGPPPMPEHILLEPPVITERASAVHAIATSPWAPLLAVTGQKQILLHHTETLELIGILPFPEGDPISLAFTPDARYLIVGGGVPGKTGLTVTFDITNGSRVLLAGKEFDSILSADIRPSFDTVATGGPSKLLNLWDTQTGERLHSIKKHTDWITALDISPDGILLASGDRNGGVWVWEAESAIEFHTLRAHQAGITSVAFRSDSNLLATASEDGSVRFWEMNNAAEVKKIDAHPGGVTAFAFGKNGAFVTAGRNLEAKFWKADFNQLHALKLPALPTAAAMDWESKRAFVADALGNVHAFSATEKPGETLTTFATNPPSIDTRLQQISARICEIHTEIESADKARADRAAAIRKAEQELDSAEKAARQARQILKASEKGLAAAAEKQKRLQEDPQASQDEAKQAAGAILVARKNLEAAKERIDPSSKRVAAARKSLENLRESDAEHEKSVLAAKAEIDHLRLREKSWSSAAINAHALKAAADAKLLALETENGIDSFHQALASLEAPSATLSEKRRERDSFADSLAGTELDGGHLEEAIATLRALDASVRNGTDTLREVEARVAALRKEIDLDFKTLAHAKSQASRLRESYLQALK